MNETRAPTSEKIKEQIKKEYLKGVKPKQLSEKYGISINTLKSWISRGKWGKPEERKVAPDAKENALPKKAGAPVGNKNAVGAGAPKRNKNAQKHGAFAKTYMDSLDPVELDMINNMGREEEEHLIYQLKLFSVRERRLLISINEYKESAKRSKGLLVKGVNKQITTEYIGTLDSNGKVEKSDKMADVKEVTSTQTEAAMNTIMTFEAELTKIQRAKTKALDSLTRLHIERERIQIEYDKRSDEIEDLTETEEDIYGKTDV